MVTQPEAPPVMNTTSFFIMVREWGPHKLYRLLSDVREQGSVQGKSPTTKSTLSFLQIVLALPLFRIPVYNTFHP